MNKREKSRILQENKRKSWWKDLGNKRCYIQFSERVANCLPVRLRPEMLAWHLNNLRKKLLYMMTSIHIDNIH